MKRQHWGFWRRSPNRHAKPARLILYAGSQGWKNPEYIELLKSAREFLGDGSVLAVTAPRHFRLIDCVYTVLKHRPTHLFYDPRWGAQTRLQGAFEALAISAALRAVGCVPICLLNDLPEVVWRKKISMVSGQRGICLMLVSPEIGRVYAPEIQNQVGPMPMPLSQETFAQLRKKWLPSQSIDAASDPTISFVGSLYEPRTSMLAVAERELALKGVKLQIFGRKLDEPKIRPEEYFRLLAQSATVFTTADQAYTADQTEYPIHLVYRYIEVLATGALLIAPAVSGAERYFSPGMHFLECPSIDVLIQDVPKILSDEKQVSEIRERGRKQVSALVAQNFFWRRVNEELRARGITHLRNS